jgi:hypothetical protein
MWVATRLTLAAWVTLAVCAGHRACVGADSILAGPVAADSTAEDKPAQEVSSAFESSLGADIQVEDGKLKIRSSRASSGGATLNQAVKPRQTSKTEPAWGNVDTATGGAPSETVCGVLLSPWLFAAMLLMTAVAIALLARIRLTNSPKTGL